MCKQISQFLSSLKWSIIGFISSVAQNPLAYISDNKMDGKNYRNIGAKTYKNGNYYTAVFYYEKAINQEPQNHQYYTELGKIHFENREFDQAYKSYKKALNNTNLNYEYYVPNPKKDLSKILKGLANTLYELSSTQSNYLEEAIYTYLVYLHNNEDDVQALIRLGILYSQSNQHEDAIYWFEKAKIIDDQNPLLYESWAYSLYNLGKFDQAIFRAQDALKYDSNNSYLHQFLGLNLEITDQVDVAIKSYQKAITYDSHNAYAHLDISRVLDSNDEPDKAAYYSNKAVEIFSESGDSEGLALANWDLGWNHLRRNEFEHSIKASREALRFDPSLVPVRFNLGLALLHNGELKEAEYEYNKGMKETKDLSEIKNHAIDDLEDALKKQPDLKGGNGILKKLKVKYDQIKQDYDIIWPDNVDHFET